MSYKKILIADEDRTTADNIDLQAGYSWQIRFSSDTEGKITRVHHGPKNILQLLGAEQIQDLFPDTHNEQLRACATNHKTRLIFDKRDKNLLSWEYVPASDHIVNVIISDWCTGAGQDDGAGSMLGYLSDISDRLTAGIILFNEFLSIFYMNKAAKSLLQQGDCLQDNQGYLSCHNPEITAGLKAMVMDQKDHLLSIDRGDSHPPLNVMLTSLNSCQVNLGKNLPTTIMFTFEIADNYVRIEEVLRSLYHLSPMEARLVAQLFITPHLATAAAALGITLNTARTHLKRIYHKTRVNRISSLIHLVVTGPASIILNIDH